MFAWWAIPLVATVLAIAWVSWSSRQRPRAEAYDTVTDYQRFRSALGDAAGADGHGDGHGADGQHDDGGRR